MIDFKGQVAGKNMAIGILGLAYIGIPLALRISEVGFPVIGFDVVQSQV